MKKVDGSDIGSSEMNMRTSPSLYDAVRGQLGVEAMFHRTRKTHGQTPMGASFASRLENHISNVRRGEAWRSKAVHQELVEQHWKNAEYLGDMNRSILNQYQGLMTSLPYGQQARLTQSLGNVAATYEILRNAPHGAVDFADKLRAVYG